MVFELMAAERSVHRWIAARADGSGLGAAGAGVLFYLEGNDHALVGQVTAALQARPAGMSGLLNRLAAAGLISKTRAPDDARAVRLSLTPEGREAAASARSVLAELNEHLADGFTPSELDTISRWLAHTASTLGSGD
ncbi:MarR family winged helix-turn-helix transcriptional regulator [Blastococcus jejuensis]|uniref:MarR family winged helix-turn-helix transcriptional regulator n=1 Tax=Blastococcus jejuensis TaxID=351224 RepID=A0ABP6NSQ3_9ACTN